MPGEIPQPPFPQAACWPLASTRLTSTCGTWLLISQRYRKPETGKPPRTKEGGRKENRYAELDKVIFQLCQIAVLETIAVYPIALSPSTVLTVSSGEMHKGSKSRRVFGFTRPSRCRIKRTPLSREGLQWSLSIRAIYARQALSSAKTRFMRN